METVYSSIPFLAVITPLCAIALIIIFNNKPNLRESWTILASLTKFGLIVSMLPTILDGKVIECPIVTLLPGIDISFRIDALGIFFALTASFLWILTSFYSIGYVRTLNEHAQTRYFIWGSGG